MVTFDFDPAFLDQLFANASQFLDFSGGAGLAGVEAIVDVRRQNVAETDVRGVDLNAAYDTDRFGLSFSGSYLSDFENKITSQAPADDVLGRVFNPAELRFRAGARWTATRGVDTNLFVNYVDELTDNRVDPSVDVDSWTTVDLGVTFDLSELMPASALSGARFQVSATNLLNEEPPRVEDLSLGSSASNFDAENHDIVGRVFSVNFTYDWQ